MEPDVRSLSSVEDLAALRQRLAGRGERAIPTIVIPAGTCGRANGALDLVRAAKRELLARELVGRIGLRVTGCHGFCEMEPSVLVAPHGTFYPKVASEEMGRIIGAAAQDRVVTDLLFADGEGERIERQDDIPFFARQTRRLLGRNQEVDPTRIEDYLASGGYAALAAALAAGPEPVVAEVKASGLRGRGGAGFPTGAKWEMLARQPGRRGKFLVCNADEGDPGAYMDRSALEGNPHAILEGMLVGAVGTGANEGVIYVRDEYPLAIRHVSMAIRQARALGLLGERILGTDLSFDIEVVRGAGAFVCGEETALIRSIEGKVGEPRQRPPFPVQRGIDGKPTLINNVETWANIPLILEKGAAEFAAVGTQGNSGTKIFSLVGKVKRTGLVEVPMGATLGEIIHDIGGGPVGAAAVKAVQTGGPSGGCIPAARFDLPVDYDALTAAGSIMGSGGMIVMDAHTCMVDVARYFMGFLKQESCGKCFTCRKGTQRMHEILDDITRGEGSPEHLQLLEELALAVKDTTMCGLGQTAANPVLSTLRYFREEYLEHIRHGRCPAAVCKALVTYSINEACTGCGACRRACPGEAIRGASKERHVIDSARCTKCGMCVTVCQFGAVAVA
ncbi:MAG: 4Fe-4S binding protein [Armatimonadetes bacterium]|nr:4Fe-4S binding protein [Armatimonadota bacterium]